MDQDRIDQVLNEVPTELRSESRRVRHFFFGRESALRRLRSQIKRMRDEATFDWHDSGLTVTTVEQLSPDLLGDSVAKMETCAADAKVEYDGFEIDLEDQGEPEVPVKSFEKYFPAGSYVRFRLDDRRFGYLHFLGGSSVDGGCIFDCLATVDDGSSTLDELTVAPRLYRQPVRGVIDPLRVELVGTEPRLNPVTVRFRLMTSYPGPEEFDAAAAEYGFRTPLGKNDWPALLARLAEAGRTLSRGVSVEQIATLHPDGRVVWTDGLPISVSDGSQPMPFGSFVRLESLTQALIHGEDVIALNDKVM